MENQNKRSVTDVVDSTMQNLRQLANVNAIIGETISLPDGTSIIPISKISFGYGSGCFDMPTKNPGNPFGGGGGAGGTIEPIAFLVTHGGEVRLLQVSTADNTADRIVNLVPQVFDKVTGLIDSAKAKKAAEAQGAAGACGEEAAGSGAAL